MRTLYLTVILFLPLLTRAQTADSVRIELATEPTVVEKVDTTKRGWRQRKLLQILFARSRPETTMFQLGISSPSDFLFIGNRAIRHRYSYGGLWAGVNHKLTPDFGVRGGVTWSLAQWNSSVDKSVRGDNWMGQLAVDYYPLIQREMRAGKTVNNIYFNPCLTLELLRPLSVSTITELKMGVDDTLVPFRQSVGIGMGQVGLRTRWFYFDASATVAYWFDRSSAVRHAIQPMVRYSMGFAF